MTSKITESGEDKGEIAQSLRLLPSIDSVLSSDGAKRLEQEFGRQLLLDCLRDVVEGYRQKIRENGISAPGEEQIVEQCKLELRNFIEPTLFPVINASGVVVHTNLGRAPLSENALASTAEIAASYSTLEYDISSGRRGSRAVHAERLLTKLTGTESALVVNNNAAAVLLVLTALCRDREVIISRSQLVEIGGGFRIPEVMAQSGARLAEVGTTNRTNLSDYAQAITEETAALFVAHHSNFKIIGFTAEPSIAEITDLAREHGLYTIYDQGSGALLDTDRFGLDPEPTVIDGIGAGVDVVTFSGDKLIGGPQSGIICGNRSLIDKIRNHPLARAVRADKMVLGALTATLVPYLTGKADLEIPVWKMISLPLSTIESRALRWQRSLAERGISARLVSGHSTVGGGSLPGATIKTILLAISHQNADRVVASLRKAAPPVIARIVDGQVVFDPRTVFPSQDTLLVEGITQALKDMALDSDIC